MRLGLGTVQFGQDYGISNRHGRPAVDEVAAILRVAADGGVDLLDTAHAYGDAEEILGELAVETAPFRVVTKTPAARVSAIGDAEVGRVRGGFSDSLARLQRTSLFGLLLHRAADLALPGGERLAETLVRLREEGKVAKVGVSVYSPADLDRVIRVFRPDLVQLPFSVLDQRFARSGHLAELRRQGVEVHLRSVFLQGVLLMDSARIPDALQALRPSLAAWRRHLDGEGVSPLAGALAVARRADADICLVGVNSSGEMGEILGAWEKAQQVVAEAGPFACDDERWIVPANWPAR